MDVLVYGCRFLAKIATYQTLPWLILRRLSILLLSRFRATWFPSPNIFTNAVTPSRIVFAISCCLHRQGDCRPRPGAHREIFHALEAEDLSVFFTYRETADLALDQPGKLLTPLTVGDNSGKCDYGSSEHSQVPLLRDTEGSASEVEQAWGRHQLSKARQSQGMQRQDSAVWPGSRTTSIFFSNLSCARQECCGAARSSDKLCDPARCDC